MIRSISERGLGGLIGQTPDFPRNDGKTDPILARLSASIPH
jgi:hypothetical protein